jgi:hypothetical protein
MTVPIGIVLLNKYTSALSNNHLLLHKDSFQVLPKTVIGVGLLATNVAAVKGAGASETEEDSYLQKSLLRGLGKSSLESPDNDKVREVSIVFDVLLNII